MALGRNANWEKHWIALPTLLNWVNPTGKQKIKQLLGRDNHTINTDLQCQGSEPAMENTMFCPSQGTLLFMKLSECCTLAWSFQCKLHCWRHLPKHLCTLKFYLSIKVSNVRSCKLHNNFLVFFGGMWAFFYLYVSHFNTWNWECIGSIGFWILYVKPVHSLVNHALKL